MTTTLPVRTAEQQRFSGLGTVLRLNVRRERLPLLIWVAAISLTVLSSLSAIAGLYPTVADRTQLAASISANPSFLALTGPITATSIGGVTAWRVGVLAGVMVGLMALLTVVRRTRADEESGRAELLASGVLGRSALLAGALLVAWGAALVIGVISALGAIGDGQPVGGSLLLGAGLAGPGLVFGAVGAVCAQIFENARTATATAGALLAAAFGVRAVGDLWSAGSWLDWLSPLGWPGKIAAYGANRWPVLLLFVVTTVVLAAVAELLSRHRDLGLGLFPARLGPAHTSGLRSGLALAVRLHRGSWIGWAVGFLILGLLTGSLATSADSLLSDNANIRQLMQDLGGPGTLVDELLAAMGGISALVAAAYAVSAALRIRSEETAGRAESVLSTGLSRDRWFAGHLIFSLGGSALLLVIAGIAAGIVHGANIGDLGAGFRIGLETMTVQIPAVLVVGGITAALIGWVPRWASLGWAVLGLSVLLGQLGALLKLPQAVMKLSPFSHIPALPAAPMDWTPLVVLLLVAVVATALGFAGFRRRDVG